MKSREIYQVEARRVKGGKANLIAALEDARSNGEVDEAEIARLPLEELADKMRCWRIWAVTALSLANGEWSGKRAANFLREARHVIGVYYYNETVWERAKQLKTDAEGHEYQMAAEMCRDEGKYWLRVGAFLGNPLLIDKAIESFEETISLAETGTSAAALAMIERETAKRTKGQGVDFTQIRQAFTTVVDLSPRVGGWDRMAAVSWMYIKEAVFSGNFKDSLMGVRNLRIACNQLDKGWLQYPRNELLTGVMGISRRMTRGDVYAEQFEIQSK